MRTVSVRRAPDMKTFKECKLEKGFLQVEEGTRKKETPKKVRPKGRREKIVLGERKLMFERKKQRRSKKQKSRKRAEVGSGKIENVNESMKWEASGGTH